MKQTSIDKYFSTVYKSSSSRSQNIKTKDMPTENKKNSYASHSNLKFEHSVKSESTSECMIIYDSVTVTESNVCSTPRKGPKYSPKVSTPTVANRFPLRLSADVDLTKCAISEMNLARQDAIPPSNFDLEEIYSKKTFTFEYTAVNTTTNEAYEFENVQLPPDDMYAKIVFNAIGIVFSNPVNCGYFDRSELDFVYSILTLSPYAQTLLGRMLKRVRTWHRGSHIKYPDIPNIQNVFQELESKCMCTFNTIGENLSTILKLLQANEISDVCKRLKIRTKPNKQTNIDTLVKYSKTKAFPGAKAPYNVLRELILKKMDYCVRISGKMWNIFDKILTLLVPNRDAQETTADTIYVIFQVLARKRKYPNMPNVEFPIFSCEEHLQSYIKAKTTLTSTLNSILNKKWDEVRDLGDLAEKEWQSISATEYERLKNSKLPMHVRYFMPGYVWLKVLSEAVDAFKKKDKDRAIHILHLLIQQECHMKHRRGQWYAELALIEMHHKKDIEGAAETIIEGLRDENLTRVGKVDLIDKAERIVKKKTGVRNNTKEEVRSLLANIVERVVPKYTVTTNTIEGSVRTRGVAGFKRKWLIECDAESQSYGSVENVALSHYFNEGFSNGVHCEGALPVLLFATLFWEELYDINIPGAFVTPYQDAPQDLYFDEFYENRKEKIDMKLQIVRGLDDESLGNIMEDKYNVCSVYESIMPASLLKSSSKTSQLKEVVCCLGVEAVVGICERLIDNYKLWRAGFPDLFVWNFNTKTHKIVEVKGPGDTLSTKQKLWLEYLSNLGLNVELCLVKDGSNPNRSSTQRD